MRGARDVHDELPARLRAAAEAHEPDRARVLARVERGMAGDETRSARRTTRPPVFGWAKVAGATAAVAGVLAVGGYAVASAVRDEAPPQGTVAVSPTPEVSAQATSRAPLPPAPTPSGGAPDSSRSPNTPSSSPSGTPSAETSPPTGLSPDSGAEDGPLWSDGSVDPHSNEFWAQSNVTLRNSVRLTSLTVELRVAQTGGVNDAGAWRSAPEDDFTTTVAEKDGFLVYTWVLRPGRTVWPGEWVFAGQYDHDRGGRDAKDDRYTAKAETQDRRSDVTGDFASRDGVGDGTDAGDSAEAGP
ncbi:hypothetical protein [Streptomyces sp. NPDC127072]|uniref:hypothetical protein n=1 Tax=Streptomyces sp. NPDC127072 TaxID=3347129 RepID=UPI00364D16EB